MSMQDQWTKAVIIVGEGRGLVINGRHDRLVVTAAHCLPFFPPCHGASYLEERTYKALLAPLGSKPSVWAECLFADPIADIAVLGSPDDQDLSRQANAYEALMESATPLAITDAPEKGYGWMLSLSGEWFRCGVEYMNRVDGPLWITHPEQPIECGMSGSPIISDAGAAIGVVCLGEHKNPRLIRDLPGWVIHLNHRLNLAGGAEAGESASAPKQ